MKFDVQWSKQFATTFFGQLIRPGGTIQVSANLAIQLHEEKTGWVCIEIDKARQSLLPKQDVTITDTDLKENVQVPGAEVVTEEVVVGHKVIVSPDQPPIDVIPEPDALQPALDLGQQTTAPGVVAPVAKLAFPCDKCEMSFPSKKKLAGHKTRVHQNG
jgi:hypothetical protein